MLFPSQSRTLAEDNNNNAPDNADYSALKVAELKTMLDSRGIEYNSTAKKDDLISLLVENDKAQK